MLVKNVNGSSRFPAPYGYNSWLHYWESSNGQLQAGVSYKCPACGDGHVRTDFVGAHVQKVYGLDRCWYIVPICRGCNQRTDNFDVNVTPLAVPSSRVFNNSF